MVADTVHSTAPSADELEFKAREVERQIAFRMEQVKLRATALNLIAIGFVVTGVIAPISQTAAGISDKPIPPQAFAFMVVWLLLALILHCGAVLTLRSLP